jgi:SAM-dependent methyltransferase
VTTPYQDFFSRDSAAYAQFRPRYPPALFEWLASVCPRHTLCWDAGTGNGQAAVELARYFERVIGSDPSEKQLAHAISHPRVEYLRGGETAGLPEAKVDLVTVAQALHWFDRARFWTEVKRVLHPGGVIAVWCYALQRVSPEVDRVINHFYRETVGPYWTPDRRLVEEGYRSVEFPFDEFTPPEFVMAAEWNLQHEMGYIGTWSAVGRAREATGRDPLEIVRLELEKVWRPDQWRRIEWPVTVRVGVSNSGGDNG